MDLFRLANLSNTWGKSGLLISRSSLSKSHPWPSKFEENRKAKNALSQSKADIVLLVTSRSPGVTFSGVFFTEDRNWILAGNKSGIQIYPSRQSIVRVFAACSSWDSKADFLLHTDEVCAFFYSLYLTRFSSTPPPRVQLA